MVLIFSKKNTNYTQQNIVDVLMQASQVDQKIYFFVNSPNHIVKIEGDIHRSQWTADNINNNFWLKIRIYDINMKPIFGYKALHIYVCFQTITYDYKTNQFIFGKCVNPIVKKGTDIADIRNYNGFWSFVNISYDINDIKQIQNPPKKQPSKKLDIINPKTGKKIKILE